MDNSRMFGLPAAPVFEPTADQFKNPIEYIRSIEPLAVQYGICKIIPPKEFKPTFSIDKNNFVFRTRFQKLSSMDGSTRNTLNYTERLITFHEQQGKKYNIPYIEDRPIDMLLLKKAVYARGGHERVTNTKKWASICADMGFEVKYSASLRNAFTKYIFPYQVYAEKQNSIESSSSSQSNPREDSERSYSDYKSSDSDSISEKTIDFISSKRIETRSSIQKKRKVRRLIFSSDDELDPAPKRPVRKVLPKRKLSIKAQTIPVSKMGATRKENLSLEPKLLLPVGNEKCITCKKHGTVENLVVCDECENAFHLSCVVPVLNELPETEWNCLQCIKSMGNDYGFEERDELRSWLEFENYANDFKNSWSRSNNMKEMSPEFIEKEFWRLISSPYGDIVVEYGADLHSSLVGSGFPTKKSHPDNEYSYHPWNLNNIASDEYSLLRYLPSEIPGMMIPWVYVGMLFSAFAWHAEDHYTFSINYHHCINFFIIDGAAKTWYGIPKSSADRFEEVMRQQVPELFESNPDLLFQLTTILSPKLLTDNGVTVCATEQYPGEFIVTFPRGYHSGFNQGFNCCEAVNFAPVEWLSAGEECVEIYSDFAKLPVFCHEELVIRSLKSITDSYNQMQYIFTNSIKFILRNMIAKELERRNYVYLKLGLEIIKGKPTNLATEKDQCSKCKCFCFFSRVFCRNHSETTLCLRHAAEEVCACPLSRKILELNYDLDVLEDLTVVTDKEESWNSLLSKVCDVSKRKTIGQFQTLCRELRKNRDPCAGMVELFIQECKDWVRKATIILQKSRRTKRNSNAESTKERNTMNVNEFREFVEIAAKLPFTAPEYEQILKIKEKVDVIEKTAARLKEMGSKAPDDEIKILFEQTSVIGIDFPSLHRLFGPVLNTKLAPYLTYKTFKNFTLAEVFKIEEAIRDANPTESVLEILQSEIKRSKELEFRVQEAFNSLKPLNMEDIVEFTNEMKSVPSVPSFSIIKSQLKEAQTLEKLIAPFLSRSEPSAKDSLQSRALLPLDNMELVVSLYQRCTKSRVTSKEIEQFKLEYDLVQNWITNTSNALKKVFTDSTSLETLMIELEHGIQFSFDEELDLCFCLSTKRSDQKIIQCKHCLFYYHEGCINEISTIKNEPNPPHFVCPCCHIQRNRPPFAKCSLDNLLGLAYSMPVIIVPPGGPKLCQLLIMLLDRLKKLEIHVMEISSHQELKSLLRRLYSLKVSEHISGMIEIWILEMIESQSHSAIVDTTAEIDLHCPCNSKSPTMAIRCINCKTYFHLQCVGIEIQDVFAARFFCKYCISNKSSTMSPSYKSPKKRGRYVEDVDFTRRDLDSASYTEPVARNTKPNLLNGHRPPDSEQSERRFEKWDIRDHKEYSFESKKRKTSEDEAELNSVCYMGESQGKYFESRKIDYQEYNQSRDQLVYEPEPYLYHPRESLNVYSATDSRQQNIRGYSYKSPNKRGRYGKDADFTRCDLDSASYAEPVYHQSRDLLVYEPEPYLYHLRESLHVYSATDSRQQNIRSEKIAPPEFPSTVHLASTRSPIKQFVSSSSVSTHYKSLQDRDLSPSIPHAYHGSSI